jgi:WD40 repeat protein
VIDKASLQATSYSADGRHVAASWIIPAEDNPEIYHCSLRMADLTDPAGGWIELDFIERTCGGLKFSPDGRWLAAGYEGSLLRLVEMASGASFDLSDIFHAATYYLEDFSFSPDARWLLIRGGDGLYRVDLAANDPSQAAGYLGNVSTDDFTSAFSPDQRLLAVYAARGQVEIYDLTSGVLLEKLKIMDWQVDSLAFSPGGRWLAAATPDGLRLWPAGPAGVLPFYRDAILLPVSLEFGFVLGFDPAARWVIFSSGMEYNLFKGSLWFWPLQGDLQFERGCASAGRNLTPGECDLYFPGEPCPQTCDQWR